jgi:small subunit ribosomal protein S16
MGKTRYAFYRVVIVDQRKKRDGKVIEEIGTYDPNTQPSTIKINSERAQYWLSVGAQPSEPLLVLLKITGDWQKFKGLPGAEGTLKVPAAAATAEERIEEAANQAQKLKAKKAEAAEKAKKEAEEAAAAKAAEEEAAKKAEEAAAPAQAEEAAPAAEEKAE